MADWNKVIAKDQDSIITENKPENKPEDKPEDKPKVNIPKYCKGCGWIKDNECRYEGDYFDDFNTMLDEESGLGECHSKNTLVGTDSVDWSRYG